MGADARRRSEGSSFVHYEANGVFRLERGEAAGSDRVSRRDRHPTPIVGYECLLTELPGCRRMFEHAVADHPKRRSGSSDAGAFEQVPASERSMGEGCSCLLLAPIASLDGGCRLESLPKSPLKLTNEIVCWFRSTRPSSPEFYGRSDGLGIFRV